MRTYLLRRFLIMIPTFFGISLLIFLVLNLAPGRPGAQNKADLASSARGEETQESHQIFREQFNLDKPILFNTRFGLSTAEVRHDLRVIAQLVDANIVERIAVHEQMADLGNYAVPHLMAVLLDPGAEPLLRDTAALFLRQNAPRRLVDPFNPAPSPEVRAHNDEVAHERGELSRLRYAFDAPDAEKRQVIEAWAGWFEKAKGRFEYSPLDKLRILFF